MALAPPKKKKIIRIIIILSSRVEAFLSETPPNETSASDAFLNTVMCSKENLFDNLPADPSAGTKPEQDMWAEIEASAGALEQTPTESEVATLHTNYQAALEAL